MSRNNSAFIKQDQYWLAKLEGEKMNSEIASVEPLVSICIPTHNRSRTLNRAVDALIRCSYENLEIIISDNASSDDTQSVCAGLTKLDSRVKYFRHAENLGPTTNFEFARAQATGKYFLWLSDDDYLDPDYIRICVYELERDPSLVIASGLGAFHSGDSKPTHFDNVVQPNSLSPLLRAVKFLWSVGDSSTFFGVYRLDHVNDCWIPNCLGGDWAWVADVLLRGRAKMIPTTFNYRQLGGMSYSRRRIASTLSVPSWHGYIPSFVISVNVASYLAFKSNKYKDKTISKKILIYSLIFGLLLLKSIMDKIRLFGSKVPFAKKIYRRFFKKQIVM
ncbi:MAG: glycosyltransferase family 2 protein [Oxalobacteraceae bacterium]|nr:glycosyltransferase family 2 protein [Oxalobacteraceae bacterium]